MAPARKVLILVLILALGLRLVSLNQSLWLDEAIGAIATRDFSYSEIVTKFISADNHTPLYYLLLKFWTSIFGSTEFALRSLSVMFGVLTIVVVFKINRIASVLLATSQMHVYFSQEARMYAMATFFAALSVLFLSYALKKNKNVHWAIFSVSLLAMVATDYMPIFLLPVFPLYVFIRKRKFITKTLISYVPLLVFGALWLPVLTFQMENYSNVSSAFIFGGATVKQAILLWTKFAFGRLSFEPKAMYYLLVGAASLPIAIALWFSLRSKKNLFYWFWLVVPPTFVFAVSFVFPIFSYFRLIYVLPAFYVLIASSNRQYLIYMIVFFNFLGLGIYYTDKAQQREQWREAVEYVEQVEDKKSIAVFEFSAPFAPYQWYSKNRIDAAGATDFISATEKTVSKTRELVADKNKIYYFEYLRDVSDPGGFVEKTIREQGFSEIAKIGEFEGVGAITIYEKNK